MKQFSAILFFIVSSLIIIPSIVTISLGNLGEYNIDSENEITNIVSENSSKPSSKIKILNPENNSSHLLEFEDYIKGVVAAEMSPSFEEEALKAQAVAARTYAYRRINNNSVSAENILEEGKDKISQAYFDKDTLLKRWGDNYNEYWGKISKAVDETRGEIMLFENEPIEAVFHSTSAGITEDAENVWQTGYPYLKSVDSSFDEESPGFEDKKAFSETEFKVKLTDKFPDIVIKDSDLYSQIAISERTVADYVKTVTIGNKSFSGREIRELFGLRSSNFTITKEGTNICFVTKGYGHGAGMSQNGANFMAKEGNDYKSILSHYYTGVTIIKDNNLIE